MHEELVRKVIHCKLDAAGKLLDRLPPEASKRIRTLGNLVYDSVGEHLKGGGAPDGAKSPGKMNNVPID